MNEDRDDEKSPLAAMTPEQKQAREDAVKAIGQRANALIRYDGVDPAIVAAALQWCATSMYAQAAADLTRETYLEACGATWDEAKEFLAALAKKEPERIAVVADECHLPACPPGECDVCDAHAKRLAKFQVSSTYGKTGKQ